MFVVALINDLLTYLFMFLFHHAQPFYLFIYHNVVHKDWQNKENKKKKMHMKEDVMKVK